MVARSGTRMVLNTFPLRDYDTRTICVSRIFFSKKKRDVGLSLLSIINPPFSSESWGWGGGGGVIHKMQTSVTKNDRTDGQTDDGQSESSHVALWFAGATKMQ